MNKIILITGGSGLIGKSIILRLLKDTYQVYNLDVKASGIDRCIDVPCDITNQSSIDTAINSICKGGTGIYGLINNAYPRTYDWGLSFEEIPYESWKENIDIQLNSIFYLTRKVLPIMKENGIGSVISMSSIYSIVANDFSLYENTNMHPPAAYSAIKGGLNSLMRYIASKYGQNGIRINTISPGGIFDEQDQSFVDAYIKKVPLGRMGTPDDVASVVSFLLSNDSAYITGQNIVVDGGYTIK